MDEQTIAMLDALATEAERVAWWIRANDPAGEGAANEAQAFARSIWGRLALATSGKAVA